MKFEIRKGKIAAPVRAVIYGSEGVGKSSLAAEMPEPLFIDVEDGTKELDVSRFPAPDSWNTLLAEIDAVIDDPTICRTLVIDTIDRAEQLLTAQLLAEGRCDSIEKYGGGYGKGYTALAERWQKDLLGRLDKVITKGVHVTLIGHAMMRKMENPEDPPYDRWELKVSKKVAPLTKEWSDLLLFCNFDVIVVEENGKGKARGKAKRKMHANHKPTYDAKNRYGLPDDMELNYEPLRDIYEHRTAPVRQPVQLNVDTPTDLPVEDPVGEDPREALVRKINAEGFTQGQFEAWLVSIGRLAPGGSVMDLSGTQVENMLKSTDTIVDRMSKVGG